MVTTRGGRGGGTGQPIPEAGHRVPVPGIRGTGIGWARTEETVGHLGRQQDR